MISMSKCARPGCSIPASSSCSVCGREQYCSSSCQKGDWKIHKSMCAILKKLSNKLQPYREVARLINEILLSKKGKDIRVLEHLLSFAEYQFGKGVTGKGYRERGDGERINNWIVAVNILNIISKILVELILQNNLHSIVIRDNMRFPYLERSLSLLNPWVINLDLDVSQGNDSLSEDQKIVLFWELYCTEQKMADIAMNRRQFDLAEEHCQRCLAYSRRYSLEGEEKITMMVTSLTIYSALRQRQGNLSDALTFAEECYNLVVEAYDPVHPQVQEAAGLLIHILIAKGDLYDAERYAQVTYGNLRDKKNGMDQEQESEEVAMGAYNLGDVIYQQEGDLIKAEELARESLRIRSLIKNSNDDCVGRSYNLLATILRAQGKLGDETRGLYERSLAFFIRYEGPDGLRTAVVNDNLAKFYCQLVDIQPTVDLKRTQLLLAKSHIETALRINLKLYGPTHPHTVNASSRLADVSSRLSRISLS
jgi:tetratricopeptide (TPR) repeat protein